MLERSAATSRQAAADAQRQADLIQSELEDKEYARAHVVKEQARGWRCHACKNVYSAFPEDCKRLGHSIESVLSVRRFFECKQCKRRTSTLDRPSGPRAPCRCGSDRFRRCTAATDVHIERTVLVAKADAAANEQ
jgi:hypothetical protein